MKKRTIALAMAAALTVTAFAGLTACGKNNTPENPVATEEAVAGGTINTQNNKAALPEDLQKVFDEAVSQAGGSQQAICYLGSQVVAGTNHAFLTQDTDGAHNFHIMIAYQDLDGKVELKSVSDLDPTAQSFGAEADGAEAGGWQIADDCYNNDLPGDAKDAVLDALLTNRDLL
ncbi:MAG: hypothetical protein MJ117_05945 [Lachnospiraceae bacterium]|nr:hypothetical protein [Lachnospiraceae bacterium]